MDKLRALLKKLIKPIAVKFDLTEDFLKNLFSVYPFNEFEYIISHLLAENIITLSDYHKIRKEYLTRNKYLYLYEITAPRTFGETWAQNHISELVQELERPNRDLDPEYSGQYDFWFQGIRIEVKASRAVMRKSGDSLINKAISTDSTYKFDMNFQQIKPACCDVFLWIGVWRNEIRYWVLSSKDVAQSPFYSKGQHRGNKGEGQLWIKDSNIAEFDSWRVSARDLLERIKACGK
ncbi:MAG: hypothetical protein Q4G69_04205 [Planctomycetia bacterium]|nr:hypothetical protein [Planctomycetia bacterium]